MKIVAIIFLIFITTFSVDTSDIEDKFDHLGLDVFHLTPEEENLSVLAYEISAKKLHHLGIDHPLPTDDKGDKTNYATSINLF